jgi:hypothetical protein
LEGTAQSVGDESRKSRLIKVGRPPRACVSVPPVTVSGAVGRRTISVSARTETGTEDTMIPNGVGFISQLFWAVHSGVSVAGPAVSLLFAALVLTCGAAAHQTIAHTGRRLSVSNLKAFFGGGVRGGIWQRAQRAEARASAAAAATSRATLRCVYP